MTPDEILSRRNTATITALGLHLVGRTVEAERWREVARRWEAIQTMPVYGLKAAS